MKAAENVPSEQWCLTVPFASVLLLRVAGSGGAASARENGGTDVGRGDRLSSGAQGPAQQHHGQLRTVHGNAREVRMTHWCCVAVRRTRQLQACRLASWNVSIQGPLVFRSGASIVVRLMGDIFAAFRRATLRLTEAGGLFRDHKAEVHRSTTSNALVFPHSAIKWWASFPSRSIS